MKNTVISCVVLAMATILLPDLPVPPDEDCVTHRVWISPTSSRAGYWTNIKVCINLNNPTPPASKIVEES